MKKADNTKSNKKAPKVDVEPVETFYTWEDMPVLKLFIDQMIEQLPDWPDKNPHVRHMEEFYFPRKIKDATWDRMLVKYPKLKEAQQIALIKMGNRLCTRSDEKEILWTSVHYRLHTHGKKFKDMGKYHKELDTAELETATPWSAIIAPVKQTEKLDEFIKKQKEKK